MNSPAPAASIASPITPWPKSESFGNMPARMSFLRTLSSRLTLRPHRRATLGQAAVSALLLRTFPGLADILDCLAADDQPHAQSAAARFGGLGRRYVEILDEYLKVSKAARKAGHAAVPNDAWQKSGARISTND